MRFLAWHVDYFKSRITERGRSPLVEEYNGPETVAENALLMLARVQKRDEAAETGKWQGGRRSSSRPLTRPRC